MCGRYTLTRQAFLVDDLDLAIGTLGASVQGEWWRPRFNIAPTQPAPVVILRDGVRTAELMRWGLVPAWAGRSGTRPPLMINARVESVQDKPMFRDAFAHRRCLVPADGFFEWRHAGKAKQPIYLHPSPPRLIAFAGLWARARTDAGETLSFTIVTGPPNALVAPIHDRMPMVLEAGAYAAWLDPSLDASGARALLDLPRVGDWIAEPVSPRVNAVVHDDPACVVPTPPEPPIQGRLFE